MAVITKKSKPQMSFPSFFIYKKIFSFVLSVAACLNFTSCEAKQEVKKANSVFALNTVFEQKIYGEENGLFSQNASMLHQNELIFSHTLAEAELYKLNESGQGTLSEKLLSLVKVSNDVYKKSNGAFDIALGNLCDLWDFDEGVKPLSEEISFALNNSGSDKLELNENEIKLNGVKLNLGGIAKGAAVGEMLEAYKQNRVNGGIISCSSAIGVIGSKNGDLFKIGVRDPDDVNGQIGVLEITDCLISTSGDYERSFIIEGEKYHHILDAKTGYPVKTNIRSVTVVADITNQSDLFTVGAYTDALSTALFSMGVNEESLALLESYSMQAIFVTDNEIYITNGLKSKFTSSSHRELKAV